MKKFKLLIHSIIFLIILSLILTPISYLLRPNEWSYGNYGNRFNIGGFYAEEKDSLDAVFVGGSTTIAGWVPYEAFEEYGFTSYNFATNGVPASLLLTMVKEVNEVQNPKLMVVDVGIIPQHELDDGTYYTLDTIKNTTDMFNNNWNRFSGILYSAKMEGRFPTIDAFMDIITYHDNYRSLFQRYKYDWVDNAMVNEDKGHYLYTKSQWNQGIDYGFLNESGRKELSSYGQTVTNDLIEYCKNDTDTTYLFVIVPRQVSTVEEAQWTNRVEDIITEAGFNFINFNHYWDEIGIDLDTDFANMLHLNTFGAVKYTKFLGNYLVEKQLIEKSASPAVYTKWQEELPAWNERFEEVLIDLEAKVQH